MTAVAKSNSPAQDQRGKRFDPRWEEGMVTVETAISLTALVMVFALLITALSAMRLQSQVCQGARDVARQVAVASSHHGDTTDFPPSGNFAVSTQGGWVMVTGTAPVARAFGLEIGEVSCRVQTLSEEAVLP